VSALLVPLFVGLARLAEVSYWPVTRWVALTFLILLALLDYWTGRNPSAKRRLDIPALAVAALLFAATVMTTSPVLGLLACLAFLLGLGLRTPNTAHLVFLSVAALGAQFVYWNYLSIFRLGTAPSTFTSAASWAMGRLAFASPTDLYLGGERLSLSVVDGPGVLIVLGAAIVVNAGKALPSLIRFTYGTCLAVGATLAAHALLPSAIRGEWVTLGASPIVSLISAWMVAAVVWRRSELRLPSYPWTTLAISSLAVAAILPSDSRETTTLRILFDESHGKWESVTPPFGTERYGRDTVYTYRLLEQWLSRRHRTRVTDGPWTRLDADVLLVKTPTSFYTPSEKRVFDDFLRNGGTAIVIGDHTNLFGTSLVINDLLQAYGLRLNFDATVPWTGPRYDYEPRWWQRDSVVGRLPRIEYQTAASISASSPFVVPLIVGDGIVAEDADYSNDRFFGELKAGAEDQQPPIVMAASRWSGNGRIILLADSTPFSNFSLMAPGNADLIQALLESAAGKRRAPFLNWRWYAIAALLLLGIIAGSRENWAATLLPVAVVPLAVALTCAFAEPTNLAQWYGGRWIQFDGGHSSMRLRADTRNGSEDELEDFSTFYAWISRIGVLPQIKTHCPDSTSVPLVVLNPARPYAIGELDDIEHYVKKGGTLLILDDPRFRLRSTSAELLGRFGIALRPSIVEGSVRDPGGWPLSSNLLALPLDLIRQGQRAPGRERVAAGQMAYTLTGVTAILTDERGLVIAGERVVGKGRVSVFAASTLFSEFILGDVWGSTETSPEKTRLYQLEYDIVEHLFARATQ
jgi:hypothetical protein